MCNTPQATTRSTRRRSVRGFTLIELMLVISAIAILSAIAVPTIETLAGRGSTQAAVNTFAAGVANARAYAGLSPAFTHGSYSGVALIVDQWGNMRLTQNVDVWPTGSSHSGELVDDDDGGNPLEVPVPSSSGGVNYTGSSPRNPANGYVDIPGRDYITLPQRTGIVGIARGGTGNGVLRLLYPPFALRFNEKGTLTASVGTAIYTSGATPAQADRVVCYDGNDDGKFKVGGGAGAERDAPYGGGAYNYQKWDPESSSYDSSTLSAGGTSAKQPLPFEKLETVVGVIVYSKIDMDSAGVTADADGKGYDEEGTNAAAVNWITQHGTTIFINRYTGALTKLQ